MIPNTKRFQANEQACPACKKASIRCPGGALGKDLYSHHLVRLTGRRQGENLAFWKVAKPRRRSLVPAVAIYKTPKGAFRAVMGKAHATSRTPGRAVAALAVVLRKQGPKLESTP